MLNLVAGVIGLVFSYIFLLLFPHLHETIRQAISLTAGIIMMLAGQVVWPRIIRLARWLVRKWRYLVVGSLLIVLEALLCLAYTDWRIIAFSSLHFALVAVAAWLLSRYHLKLHSHVDFFEDFECGLENWSYHGQWRTEKDGDRSILVVSESENGGIARPCQSWTDYVFEFETKIVKHDTSWLVRAKDTRNCVMLQCEQDRVLPYFRREGDWSPRDWAEKHQALLPVTLPLDTWFGVRIETREAELIVTMTLNDMESEILRKSLLEPPIAPMRYSVGSVGFREAGDRCAHFRNVRVRRI